MRTFQRVIRAWRFHVTFSIFLVIVLLSTSLPDAISSAKAAPIGEAPAIGEGTDAHGPDATTPSAAPDADATLEFPPPNIMPPDTMLGGGDIHPVAPITVSALARPDEDLELKSHNNRLTLRIPRGAVDREVQVEIIEHGSWGPRGAGMLSVFELKAFAGGNGDDISPEEQVALEEITSFNKELTLSIEHAPNDLQGLDVDTLKLYHLDESTRQWVPVASSAHDPATNTLTATIDHFSYYGENAEPTILGPKRIEAFLMDLHSGAATASYDIEVPPGSGDFQPSIQLAYNSAIVDEMKNKRSVGSWVGIGWSLDMGAILYDAETDEYLLASSEGAYKLIEDSQGFYHTVPESFYKITRTGQRWDVYDTEGTYYRFGGTTDSQQYYDDSTYYGWDLSYMQDSNTENAITVTYVQDMWTDSQSGKTHVRSAYPQHVRYNNDHVDIQFNSSYDSNDPEYGPLRTDNPQDPKPKVIENRKLDSIEIKTDGELVRKYVFTYNTTDDYYSDDYGGIYYAGKHTLTSITEIGADDTSQLPAMSFTYTDLEIYHEDSAEEQYSGNPGNPASLAWPYLTSVTNGYGATTNYSYTQTPAPPVTDIWTREVVTSMALNPGTGPEEIYQYTYTGDPQYLHVGPGTHAWNDQYRGFPQVRAMDAQGNYAEHYFWTTGNGEAETFTGREYRTEWYDSTDQLLERKEYTWAYRCGNDAPEAHDQEVTTREDTSVGITLAASDADGDSLAYSVVNEPAHGALSGTAPNLSYTPAVGYDESDSFTYHAYDGIDYSNTATVAIDINPAETSVVLDLQAQQDTWLDNYHKNTNYGSEDRLAVNSNARIWWWYYYSRAIMQFDTASIPQGATISSANMKLYTHEQYSSSVTPIRAYRITESWDEDTATYSNASADYDSSYIYDTEDVYADGWYSWDITELVQEWVDGTYDNYGVMLRGAGSGNYWKRFRSSEYNEVHCRPHLEITYTGGEGPINTPPIANDDGPYSVDQGGTLNVSAPGLLASDVDDGGAGSLSAILLSEPTYGTVSVNSDGSFTYSHDGSAAVSDFFTYEASDGTYTDYATARVFINPSGPQVGLDLQADHDAFLDIHNRDTNYGSAEHFLVNKNTNELGYYYFERSVIQFGLPGLPTDATITSAEIRLYCDDQYLDSSNPTPIQAYRITELWDESTVTYNSAYDKYDSSIAYDTVDVQGDGWYSWDITELAKEWVDGTYDNYGVMLRGAGSGNYWKQFRSSEYSEIEYRPHLEITYARVPFVYLEEVTDTIGAKTSRTRYEYDDYGNVIAEYQDGDISTSDDDVIIRRDFYPNTSNNILDKAAEERVYDHTDSLAKEVLYYYDGNNISVTTPPTTGNLTRLEEKVGDGSSLSTYYTYDAYGNRLTETDPNGNTWETVYESTCHTFPESITSPIAEQFESYTFDPGTGDLLSRTDVNSQTTTYEYDTFGRLTKEIKTGDSSASPTLRYEYNDWGTLNQQHLKILAKVDEGDYLWSSWYFDGLGRVIQTHARGGTGRTIIASTNAYDSRGSVHKVYVSQDLDSSQVNGYKPPEATWKCYSIVSDGLGRPTSITAPDETTYSSDYSVPWQETVTNPRGFKHRYYYDAFERLTKVEELDASDDIYATTTYSYDALDNLIQVVDAHGNTTTMNYDWLSHKTSMTDPDMGSWSYEYDGNGNLIIQTDAKNQTITSAYDALNRVTNIAYPAGSGMVDVTYAYDSTTGGNYGEGRRTSMTDASGTTVYKYDARGRVIEEKRTVDEVDYVTQFAYDAADRLVAVTYPTGETVTQVCDGRGLPYSLSGSAAGDLVTETLYNQLGQITQISLGNGAFTTFQYYGLDAEAPSGYYGLLWRISSANATEDLQDVRHIWDANSSLIERQDVIAGETETFGYDFLDRLTSASGPYTQSYTYDEIGNITSMDGASYAYGAQPHAVTAVGGTTYAYDANGNMTQRGDQTITWDVENKPISVTDGQNTSTFVYDGDGNRVLKTEGGETILYVNRYYEKNLTTGEVTTHYYLGDRKIAYKNDSGLKYVHQDHLTGTSLTTDSSGSPVATIKYFPFGATRLVSGNLDTEKRFTGQRLDETGLYFYNARYYDAQIGRFVSPDTIVPDWRDPQSLNRYSYCLNNPLKYVDPSGHSIAGALGQLIAGVLAGIGTAAAQGGDLLFGAILSLVVGVAFLPIGWVGIPLGALFTLSITGLMGGLMAGGIAAGIGSGVATLLAAQAASDVVAVLLLVVLAAGLAELVAAIQAMVAAITAIVNALTMLALIALTPFAVVAQIFIGLAGVAADWRLFPSLGPPWWTP